MGRNLYNLFRRSVCAKMTGRRGDVGQYNIVCSLVRGQTTFPLHVRRLVV